MGAKVESTQDFSTRHPNLKFKILGKTGYTVSPLGFGGYRTSDRSPAHHEALKTAILAGCNLLDTSTNYMDGESEILFGRVIRELASEKKISREEVVIVSKAGYVQGRNMVEAKAKIGENSPYPEMVHYSPECWHCISPRFLEDQITRSLARLKMDTIDVFLLHNPEYFLKVENDHREYYRRIEQAFTYLETEVKRGRIQFYGISSNTFPESREFPEFTSFETTLEIAERISPSHHYAVIQFPFNLYEVGAWLNQDNSGKSLLEAAMQGGLGTLTNRPLNAFQENGMVRLADFPSHDENQVRGDLKDSLTEVMALEAHYPARAVLPAQRFSWGHILKQNLEKLSDLDRWKQVRNHQILPALTEACGQLVLHSEFKNWTDNYLKSTLKLFSAFTHYLECSASRRSEEISKVLADVCPDLSYSRTLSQKSIQVYRAVPGITSILVGMRSESYVQDCVAAMQSTPRVSEDDALKILEALHNTQ